MNWIDPMLTEAYRLGVKQLGETEFQRRAEAQADELQDLLMKNLAKDEQGMCIGLIALDLALRGTIHNLRNNIRKWVGADKDSN
jgi:hypothetical protein